MLKGMAKLPVKLRGGPAPENLKTEHMTDPEKLREFLHKTIELTDEAFEDIVNDLGYRTALLVLRAKAVSGDIKALELYLKLCRELKAQRVKKTAAPLATPENAAFVRVRRADPE